MILKNQININGSLQSEDLPAFTAQNRAFRYGDALFETIRITHGKIQFLDKHVYRMINGMNVLKMNIPTYFSVEFFHQEITKLILCNKITKGGRVRITIYRDAEGYYTPETNNVGFVIEAIALLSNEYELNKDGLVVDLYDEEKLIINKFSSIKTNNCLSHVLAAIYKKEKKLDECLIINELGSISESISSNVFAGLNGVLYTPSINQGMIPGVMRSVIMQIAKENKLEVQECPLNPQVLLKADEVFLTNAINGIQWIGAYKSKRYFSKTSRLLTDKLNVKVANLMKDLQEN